MEQLKKLSDEIKVLDSQLSELEKKQTDIILSIPNIPSRYNSCWQRRQRKC